MKKVLVAIIMLIILAFGLYLLWNRSIIGVEEKSELAFDKKTETRFNDNSGTLAKNAEYRYTEEYINSDYDFSFKYPSGFTVSSFPNEDNKIIVVQNTATNIGIQIVISPFPGGYIDITPEYIKVQIPDLKVSESQEVLIGKNRKGLAFLSDNQAFGGSSREVWFVWNGNLYQISTYADTDSLLKGLFETWKFNNK